MVQSIVRFGRDVQLDEVYLGTLYEYQQLPLTLTYTPLEYITLYHIGYSPIQSSFLQCFLK